MTQFDDGKETDGDDQIEDDGRETDDQQIDDSDEPDPYDSTDEDQQDPQEDPEHPDKCIGGKMVSDKSICHN